VAALAAVEVAVAVAAAARPMAIHLRVFMTTTLPIRQSCGSRVIRPAQVGFPYPLRWHGAAGYPPPPGFPDTTRHHPRRKDPPAMQALAARTATSRTVSCQVGAADGNTLRNRMLVTPSCWTNNGSPLTTNAKRSRSARRDCVSIRWPARADVRTSVPW
jgi:hypothetical protein